MKRRLPRKKDRIQSDCATYAPADRESADGETGTSTPSATGVKEAKDRVDHSEK